MSLDPAALQILIARCTGIAEEMGAVLQRAASSPNIKERVDCSAALFTATGELLVQAEHIPVHLGSMPAAVAAAIEACGDAVGPGDQIVVNDPYAGGTHLNDITLVAPVFAGDELIGWAANRAHHADVGGIAPGSMPPDALVIEEEGLRIPPTVVDAAVEELIATSSRAPAERRDDLAAQRGANTVGAARLGALVTRLGGAAPLQEIVDYGERRMRAALRAMRRRRLPVRGRTRQHRSAARAAASGAGGRHGHHRRRGRALRLLRKRRTAARQRERGRGRDGECGRVRAALRDRPDDPRERRRDASGHRGRAARARSSPPSIRRRSAPATSRSASGWPTCVWARSRRRCRVASARRGRGR